MPNPDPILKHARREAVVILSAWALCTAYCCTYCYLFGYIRPGRGRGADDLQFVLGIPSWFAWGVLAPWVVCFCFSIIYAGAFMADDDLGSDRADKLERDIRDHSEDCA